MAFNDHCAVVEEDGARANCLDHIYSVRNKQNRGATLAQFSDFRHALSLKVHITDAQRLIDDQNIWFETRLHGER